MSRPKHQDKDLEKVLAAAEQQGWRVDRRKKYYKMKCPCEALHQKTVHLSPSSSRYRQNLMGPVEPGDVLEGSDVKAYYGEFKFHVSGCPAGMLEGHLDDVLDLLHDDDRIIDPDFTASLKHARVCYTLSVRNEDQGEAYIVALGALRSAVHAAGGRTSDWESITSSFSTAELADA